MADRWTDGRTDGLNLHGRLSAFPISRMHTFSGAQEWFEWVARNGGRRATQRGRVARGLIINGADFDINQGRESRCASSRMNEKTGKERLR